MKLKISTDSPGQDFAFYSRLGKCVKDSNGKKNGNVHLKKAFSGLKYVKKLDSYLRI